MRHIIIALVSIISVSLSAQLTDTGDKVGIGTTNPTEKLDVDGIVKSRGGIFEAIDPIRGATTDNWRLWFKYGRSISGGKIINVTEVGEHERRFNYYDLSKTSNLPSGSLFSIKDTNVKDRLSFTAWDDRDTRFSIANKDGKEIFKTGNLLPDHKDNPTNADINFVHLLQPNSRLAIGTWALYKPDHHLTVRGSGWFEKEIITDSKIGIGVSLDQIPNNFKLAVNGAAIAEEVKVELIGQWPDYVFDPGYQLEDLENINEYIQKHRHLRGIPSANIVEKEGIFLGDMNARLLKKVEELTLYTIAQDKQLKEQQKHIDEMAVMLQMLQKELQNIQNN